MIIDPDCLPKPPDSIPAHPGVQLALRLRRLVSGDVPSPPGERPAYAPTGLYEGDDVAMNQFGAVSVRTPSGWLGVKPDEMRWLNYASADVQAKRNGGLAALVDHVYLDAEHDRIGEKAARDSRTLAIGEAEQVCRDLAEKLRNAAVAAVAVVASRGLADRVSDQFTAAENAVMDAANQIRRLDPIDMPF